MASLSGALSVRTIGSPLAASPGVLGSASAGACRIDAYEDDFARERRPGAAAGVRAAAMVLEGQPASTTTRDRDVDGCVGRSVGRSATGW